MIKHLIAGITALVLAAGTWAQTTDSLQGSRLSETEAAQLRELLKTPPPPGALRTQIDAHFRRMDAAAVRLGDAQERERVLREWTEASPDIDARWTYASFLLTSEKIAEGFRQFEALIKTIEGPDAAVRARARLAVAYIDQHNLKRAEQLLDEAGDIIKKNFSRPRAGAAAYWFVRAEMEFNNIRGRLLMRKGRFEEALEASRLANAKGVELQKYESLVDSRQRIFSRAAHAWAATESAWIYIAMGRLFDADETLRQTYGLYKKYDLTEDSMVDFYRRVADLRFTEGRYTDAGRILERVLELQRQQGQSLQSAQVFFTRSGIHRNLVAQKKWGEALKKFDEIDALAANNPRLQSIARQPDLRVLTYLNSNRPLPALRIMRSTLAWSVDSFGANHYYTALNRGLYAMALAASPEAADQRSARTEFEQAVKDMTAPSTLAVDYQESPFRQDLRQQILKAYLRQLTASGTPDPRDGAEAFMAANHLIASTVQQAIAEAAARSGIRQPELAAIVRSDQDAKNELASLYSYISSQASEGDRRRNDEIVKSMRARIAELESARKAIKTRIQQQFPEYFQLLQPKAPTPEDIASRLGRDELFVSILPLEGETFVFAITQDGRLQMHRASMGQAQMASLVKQVRTTLDVADQGAKAPAFDFRSAHAIYAALFKPLEPLMQGKEHLIVATSGSLGQLPLAVLPTQAGTPARSADAPWLIKQMAISHIPSANAWVSLKRLAQAPSGTQPLLAWGDPLFNREQVAVASTANAVRAAQLVRRDIGTELAFPAVEAVRYADIPPLPETRDEVLALARTLGADPARDVILGAQATRESVLAADRDGRLAKKQVVVFATHGLLPGDLPRLEQPALAMAASEQKDASPLLTLEDVLGLKLNADWVVLSACNTAGADGRVEEALSGLARGFFYAGSRSLLVTHWSVESESAMQLTTHAFAAYKANPRMTRANALRTATLKVMEQPAFGHPAYWAPYALVGEGSR